MNRVVFIGAGPGDPELLTLQGAAALEVARTVFVQAPYAETFAERLIGKELLTPGDYSFAQLIELIEKQLTFGPVAFLVPGDLAFYSPYQGLINFFAERSVVVAGVGVANAASARLKRTLDLPAVCTRTIIYSPKIQGEEEQRVSIENLAAPGVSLLIYMNNLPLPELVERLRKGYGSDMPIALLHRLGLPDERIIEGKLSTIVAACNGVDYFFLHEPEKKPALTLVIVGESLQALADGSWWDRSRGGGAKNQKA